MKKIFYLFTLIFMTSFSNYAKTINSLDGYITFEVPEECNWTDIYHRDPSKLELSQWSVTEFYDNFNSFGKPLYELLKKNNFKLDYNCIKKLLINNNYQESGEFVINPNYHQEYIGGEKEYIGYLPKSYKPIIMDDILGEEYFWLPVKYCIYNEYRATGFSYHITFALPDRLEIISFGINSIDYSAEELVNSFPQWFEMRKDGLYYWINQECLDAMYDLLFSDDYKKLPRDLQLIRETRDMILQTVRINNPPVDTSKLMEGVITH